MRRYISFFATSFDIIPVADEERKRGWGEMINKVRLSALMVCLSICLLACGAPVASTSGLITEPYDYPFKPDFSRCQIPEDILPKLSTPALAETVLNYPMLSYAWSAYVRIGDFDYGINGLATIFNGLPELFNRKDAGTALLAIYRTMDPGMITVPHTEIPAPWFRIIDIELLLAQNQVLTGMSNKELQSLVIAAKDAYEKKLATGQYGTVAGPYGRLSAYSLCVIGRAMKQAGFQPFLEKLAQDTNLQYFLKAGDFQSIPYTEKEGHFNDILTLATEFA
jgi:hypothetical protein